MTPAPARRPAIRRWAVRLGLAVLGLLALVLIVLIGARLYLATPAGQEQAAALAAKQLNAILEGRVEVGKVELAPPGVVLRGLKLYDPDGKLVAEVEEVTATARILELTQGRVDLLSARVLRPRLYLVQDEKGLNLARAVRPKKRAGGGAPSGKPSSFRLDAADVSLSEGYADFVSRAPGAPERRYTLEELKATGAVHYAAATRALEANAEVTGRAAQPAPAPLTASASIHGEGDALSGQASVSLGAAKASVRASEKGTEQAALFLDALELPPDVAKAFVGGWPLQAALGAHGSLERKGNVATLALAASAGAAQLEAHGSVDIARWRTDGLSVHARHVNLEELFEGALPSDLALDLDAKGSGTSLENLEAEVSLEVPASQVAGQPLGPVRLAANASQGKFALSELHAVIPGLRVSAEGAGTPDEVHLTGHVEATDLAATANSLGALGAEALPKLAGAGTFDFQLDGAPTHPGVALSGGLTLLRVSDVEVKEAKVAATVPDVRRPLEAQAEVGAKTVRLGERTFQDVTAKLTTRGREVDALLSSKGLADIVAHLTGTLDRDANGILLSSFELEYPEAHWKMQEQTRVTWGDGALGVEPLTLVAGEQRLSLSGSQRGNRVRASVEAQALDLGRLPRVLLDPRLGLAGLLTATVKVDGTLPRPDGTVKLSLSGGGVRKLSGLTATLAATYRRDRAVGKLDLDGTAGSLQGDFDVPVAALIDRKPEKVRVELTLAGLRVGELLTGLELGGRADGQVSGTVKVDGTAADPKLDLALGSDLVRIERSGATALDAEQVQLRVASGAESRLGAKLALEGLGGEATLALDTPLTVSGLLAHPPSLEGLLTTRVGAELEAKKVDLAEAAKLGLLPKGWSGEVHLRSSAKGSVRAPEGTAYATLTRFSAPGVPPTDAVWRAVAAESSIETTFEAKRNMRTVVALKGKVGAPLKVAFDGAALRQAALEASADVGPFTVTEALPSEAPDPLEPEAAVETGPRKFEGVVEVHLEATGNLDAPRLKLRGAANRLTLGKTPVGKARLAYDYADARHTLQVEFAAPGGGGLDAKGEATLPLSFSALRQGLDWKAAPFQLGIKADRFDVAFLSGLTPMVRTLGGKLQADAQLSGKVGDPDFRGAVDWSDGHLGLMGYGEYRGIHLALEATEDRFVLKELTAQGGAGTARVAAQADRDGGAYQLKGTLEAKGFPIVFDDQLFALATLSSSFGGDVSLSRLDLTELSIPEAHIELPQVKRKDLQPLQRPDDIVLTRNGKPLGAKPKPSPSASPVQAKQSGGFQARAVVNAPRNLWVKGSDVNVELGLSDGFRIELGQETQMFGEVRVLRGKAEVIGRRFDIQKDSQVRFAGPAASPYININAVYVSEREGVTVNVAISGKGKDLTIKPTSQPPLSETEIYTLLATGRRTLKRDSGATVTGAQAASVVGSLAASQLRAVLSQKVPLDVLTVEAGEEGLAGTRVEAGTYLSDKAYLGYTGQLGADPSKGENSHEVKFEYQISPRWSFEAKYGDAMAGAADLIWSKDY